MMFDKHFTCQGHYVSQISNWFASKYFFIFIFCFHWLHLYKFLFKDFSNQSISSFTSPNYKNVNNIIKTQYRCVLCIATVILLYVFCCIQRRFLFGVIFHFNIHMTTTKSLFRCKRPNRGSKISLVQILLLLQLISSDSCFNIWLPNVASYIRIDPSIYILQCSFWTFHISFFIVEYSKILDVGDLFNSTLRDWNSCLLGRCFSHQFYDILKIL